MTSFSFDTSTQVSPRPSVFADYESLIVFVYLTDNEPTIVQSSADCWSNTDVQVQVQEQ